MGERLAQVGRGVRFAKLTPQKCRKRRAGMLTTFEDHVAEQRPRLLRQDIIKRQFAKPDTQGAQYEQPQRNSAWGILNHDIFTIAV